jgi:hypothetical protein
MSQATQNLRARRLELVRRVALQRQDLRNQVGGIRATLGNLADGLSPARWLRASPSQMLLAAGAVVTLVVSRGWMLRTLGAGVAMVGILQRYRNTFQAVGQMVRQLGDDQAVRRSR